MPSIAAVIPNGGLESAAVNFGSSGAVLALGMIIPALTTSTAVTFKVSDKVDGTYVSLVDKLGAAISVAASTSAARAVSLLAEDLAGWQFLKCVVANAQAAERTILFEVRGG